LHTQSQTYSITSSAVARPGGNLTGVNFFNTELAAKQFGLLRELLPRATRVAVLVNQANITAAPTLGTVETAARAIGLPPAQASPDRHRRQKRLELTPSQS
jgi:ABC-type uncharacterized transport system substrate-binding protein